jgi:hypothetical protein
MVVFAVTTAAPKVPQPPAVGSWVRYAFKRPKMKDSLIRYAVVAGDASGRRRFEIEVEEGGRLARFGYDLLPDGSRTRQVMQLGKKGVAIRVPTLPLPEAPPVTPGAAKKPPKGTRSKRWRQVTVPAGRFRCQEVKSVQGIGCIDPGLMPMQLVRFKGGQAGTLVLIERGFDAQAKILGEPKTMPKLDLTTLPTFVAPPLPFTP